MGKKPKHVKQGPLNTLCCLDFPKKEIGATGYKYEHGMTQRAGLITHIDGSCSPFCFYF